MKNRLLKDSFKNAFNGIFQAFKTERNVRYHTISAILAIASATFLQFSRIEWVILVLTITIVFVTELLNTAVEYAIDMVCGHNYNEIAKYAKDIAAGATLIAAFGAVGVFLILYIPKIYTLMITN
jgi:diacylglycerol kinase